MPRTVAERADLLAPLGEIFREHGYEGASLARIAAATGLGKGSLYHFFPGGKEEMAAVVLAEIDGWFETRLFAPLAGEPDAGRAIADMFETVTAYFRSGRRVCLVGVMALSDTRDRFAEAIRRYFARWIAALAAALVRRGRDPADARAQAEAVVGAIQGAIVLARALDEPAVFERAVADLRARLASGR